MKKQLDIEQLTRFYRNELDGIMRFWLRNAVDREHGGYFTCFNNQGTQLVSTDKYIWSQGRMLWVLSRWFNQFNRIRSHQANRYLDTARLGAEFLVKHARLDTGNCAFVTDRRGKPKLQPGQSVYDTSIYVDCFVIYGMAEYARASGERQALDFALELYRSVTDRFARGQWRSYPYPVPAGYKMHGVPMIMLETTQELADNARQFGSSSVEQLRQKCSEYAHEVMGNHLRPDKRIREFISTDNSLVDTMLGRHINPGHTFESMWFVLHHARRNNNAELIQKASETVRATFEFGWDDEFGGFPLFLDQDGGKPRGNVPPELTDHTMISKLHNDWDSKLWWVHGEALYALLLCYELTNDERFLDGYRRTHDYTFSTFPNPDKNTGEWIQIRSRDGRPMDKVVALPVKDPFHVPRNMMLILKCLAEIETRLSR